MWYLYLGIILFYTWPALAALALWLAWKNFHVRITRRAARGMLIVQVAWIILIVATGMLAK